MKIKLSNEHYTGSFGGAYFVDSEAEVDGINRRLTRACAVTGYTVTEVVEEPVAKKPVAKKPVAKKPVAKRKRVVRKKK